MYLRVRSMAHIRDDMPGNSARVALAEVAEVPAGNASQPVNIACPSMICRRLLSL